MNKLKLELENCYGIKKLKHEFDFSNNNVQLIYSPNGMMKTSLANTLFDCSEGKESKDIIFPERPNKRMVLDESDNPLNPENIFVIEPYNPSFHSQRISTLLVNDSLKKRYEEILKDIDKEKSNVLSKFKQLSGLSGRNNNIESEISASFSGKELFEIFSEIDSFEASGYTNTFGSVIYKNIFEPKIIAFLNTKDFKHKITEYIDKYNSLIDSSDFLKKGFNHYNASTIQKNLKDNGFFKAQHSINLYDSKTKIKQEVSKEDDFSELINKEMEKVLNDKDIQKKFNEIDKKLTTAQLREFRDYLFDNKYILSELSDINSFRKKVWVSYFIDTKDSIKDLLKQYKIGKNEIEQIIQQAKVETTKWEKVIDIFNKRFSVPFRLELQNQEDVILKSEAPTLNFKFYDKDLNKENDIAKDQDLIKVLSQGERRAYYLLNIIFEIEVRKESNQETLFIADDIADSFDYKNKYAIIEYVKEISTYPFFKQLILTHNFDFFRTIQERILDKSKWENSFISQKANGEVKLICGGEKRITNPFGRWKNKINDDNVIFIASIPFVRNLVDYREGSKSDNYKLLTSLLHIKDNTRDIIFKDLKPIFIDTLKGVDLSKYNDDDKVFDFICTTTDILSTSLNDDNIDLENKISLSITIRLKAEEFIFSKVADKSYVNGSQTGKIIERYKTEFSTDSSHENNIQILEQVNLMTPENIHLNSFMYEPIMDLSNQHLLDLFSDIKTKLN